MKNKLARAIKNRVFRNRFFKNSICRSLMNTVIWFFLLPGICFAADNVLVSEVLYDPIGTETGGEAVELYNPTNSSIDISRYVVRTESSAVDATIPAGSVIEAGEFYLIADTGWNLSRDNESWPAADHEEAITMANSDSGIALVHANGTIIDAVGWGAATGIVAGLFEGTPSGGAASGRSLRRTESSTDTNNNSADFVESIPELRNSLTAGEAEENLTEEGNLTGTGTSLSINVSILNNVPTIGSIEIADEDDIRDGIQITPEPGAEKIINFGMEVEDVDGIEEINSISVRLYGPDGAKTTELVRTENLSDTNAQYNGSFRLQFYESAGTYNLSITVSDAGTNRTRAQTFEYLRMIAITIDATSLMFEGARLGASADIRGDFALSTLELPTLRNTGNTEINIGMYGTNLTDNEKKIAVENIRYSFDNDFESEVSGILSGSVETTELGLARGADSIIGLGFRLFVPATTQNGNYTGNVTVVAVSG